MPKVVNTSATAVISQLVVDESVSCRKEGVPPAVEKVENSPATSWLGPPPVSSVTLMAVVDVRGHLTPLYTARDLVRWCRAAWRVELQPR
ncbi:MAG TPA: hypothetical protein VFU31_12860 [Candidatus Binatia bacterium]|nr:hypothetical protein [Candidatus Binatia bacterium]